MSLLRALRTRLRETVSRRRTEEELDEEIRFHVERDIEARVRRGEDPDEARRAAIRSFGKVERVKEQAREELGFRGVELVRRELRHAGRRLRRDPGFAITVMITLALGIGATTAIFSVLDGVVLAPLPYGDAGHLVTITHTDAGGDDLGMPDGGYFYYRDRATTLSDIAVWIERSATVSGTGEPLELRMITATPSLLRVLGVEPMLGRGFKEEEGEPGAPDVAVITYSSWMRRYGGDPDVLGRPLIEGLDLPIVGVLPPSFDFIRPDATVTFGREFDEPDVLIPLSLDRTRARFGNFMYQSIARLAPGASARAAARELEVLMKSAPEAYPGAHTVRSLEEGAYRPVVSPVKRALVGDTAGVLWILVGAVGLVLVIAAVNVANLFIVRAEARWHEMVVRRALGAQGGALAGSVLSEVTLLAVAGGALGIVLAWLGTRALLGMLPPGVPRIERVGLDDAVLSFAGVITLLTAFACAAAPAARLRRVDVTAAFGDESRTSSAGRGRVRARHALAGSQVAFSLILLVGSALLVRTFGNLRAVDPGFDPHGVLTLRLALPARYDTDVERTAVMMQLTDRLRGVPGVDIATFSADLPLDGDEWRDYVATEDAIPEGDDAGISATRVFIGPRYLETIGARMRRGRELTRADFAGYPEYAVVNQAFADQRWPGEDPIGKRLAQWAPGQEGDVWYTVSGVVRDIRESSLSEPARPTVYLPTVFRPDDSFAMFISNMVLLVKASGDPLSLLPRIRDEIRAQDPEIPINGIRTLDRLVASSFQRVRFAMTLLVVSALVAVILAVVGIYGTVSYVVGRRRREFAVRIALGATGGHVRRAVLRTAAGIAGGGIAVGLVVAAALGRVLGALLFGVSPVSPGTFTVVAMGLLAVVVAAASLPARRASRVEPMIVIRTE